MKFWQTLNKGPPPFHFALGNASYVASPFGEALPFYWSHSSCWQGMLTDGLWLFLDYRGIRGMTCLTSLMGSKNQPLPWRGCALEVADRLMFYCSSYEPGCRSLFCTQFICKSGHYSFAINANRYLFFLIFYALLKATLLPPLAALELSNADALDNVLLSFALRSSFLCDGWLFQKLGWGGILRESSQTEEGFFGSGQIA